jgi:hypothetical protein
MGKEPVEDGRGLLGERLPLGGFSEEDHVNLGSLIGSLRSEKGFGILFVSNSHFRSFRERPNADQESSSSEPYAP